MRRFLSFVLLAAIGLPAVAPALALAQDTESSLPACCRRHGAHHCSMPRPSSSAPAFSERCPSFPQPSTAASQTSGFALIATPRLTAGYQASLLVQHPTTALRSSSHDFALYKRGPPLHLL